MTEEMIDVEVVYGEADEQLLLSLQAKPGVTVKEAISQSGILGRFPDIDLSKNKVGIFGKAAKLETPLSPGDRVEIYRPLIADPKEARKKRASKGKVMKKGGA